MARGINKVILIGNLGGNPESFTSSAGVKLKLATSESWKDKNGTMAERTEWHQVVLFGRLGEIAAQYLTKGSKVYIEGSLRTNKYTDKDGAEKYSTSIIANNLQMLDSKGALNETQDYMAVKHQSVSSEEIDDLPF